MSELYRIQLLLKQNKYDLAEKEIKRALLENPNSSESFSFLALAYLGLKKNAEAIEAAKKGVGLSPYSGFALYILSRCYINNDQVQKAEETILNALQIDPNDEDYLCTYAVILNDLNKKEDALEAINRALQNNAEHADSKKIKTIILRGLGRYQEAEKLADEAVAENPEDAMSFAVKGWASLDSGKPKDALMYFRSAVMLDPNSEYAKSGMVMAYKAQNKLFNMFYLFYNWVNHLSSGVRWGLIIGVFILVRIINKIGNSDSGFAPFFNVLLVGYVIFVFLSWTINPIFNIFLRFNKFTKYALNKGQIIASNVMCGLIISALAQYVLSLVTGYPLTGAIGSLFLTLPTASAFNRWDTKAFMGHLIYCIALLFILALSVATSFNGPNSITGTSWLIFLVGVVGYTWYVQFRKN